MLKVKMFKLGSPSNSRSSSSSPGVLRQPKTVQLWDYAPRPHLEPLHYDRGRAIRVTQGRLLVDEKTADPVRSLEGEEALLEKEGRAVREGVFST